MVEKKKRESVNSRIQNEPKWNKNCFFLSSLCDTKCETIQFDCRINWKIVYMLVAKQVQYIFVSALPLHLATCIKYNRKKCTVNEVVMSYEFRKSNRNFISARMRNLHVHFFFVFFCIKSQRLVSCEFFFLVRRYIFRVVVIFFPTQFELQICAKGEKLFIFFIFFFRFFASLVRICEQQRSPDPIWSSR